MEAIQRFILVLIAAIHVASAVAAKDDFDEDPQNAFWQNAYCINPSASRNARLTPTPGSASLLFDIKANGETTNIRIVATEAGEPGNERIAASYGLSARRAVKQWEYFAYIEDGAEAPRHDVSVTFHFVHPQDEHNDMPREQACTTSLLPEPPSHVGDPTDALVNLARCWVPNVPISAELQKLSGTAALRFDVDKDGNVQNIQLPEGSAGDPFVKEAEKALEKWRYHPYLDAGQPLARTDIVANFSFGEAPEHKKKGRKASCLHAEFGNRPTISVLAPVKQCIIKYDADGIPEPNDACRKKTEK